MVTDDNRTPGDASGIPPAGDASFSGKRSSHSQRAEVTVAAAEFARQDETGGGLRRGRGRR